MKQKFILKLCLMMAAFLLFYSCRHDLIQDQDAEGLPNPSFTSNILHYQDLQKNPDLFAQLEKVTGPKTDLQQNRIYTDPEHEFSVELEDYMFIEDLKGRKSYTFKITRKEKTDYLENLVLFEKSENVYDAYIMEYDREVQHNTFNSNAELHAAIMKHVRYTALGERKFPEIAGKATALCEVLETIWVDSGTSCASGQHEFSDGAACTYWGTTQMATHNGGWVMSSSSYDCGGTGSGSGSGGGTTGPYGGGGASTTLQTRCQVLKNSLERAKTLSTTTSIKNKNDIMKATITTDLNEKGFAFGMGAGAQYQTGPIINMGTNGGSVPLDNLGFPPQGMIHNHNGTAEDDYPSPSPTDIYGLYNSHQGYPSYEFTYVNGADGSQFVMSITDQFAFDDFVFEHPMTTTIDLANNFWIEGSEIYDEFYNAAQYFRNNGSTEQDSFLMGMAFVTTKYNMGMVISQKESSGNFRPLEVKEKPDPSDSSKSIYELTYPCGL